MFYIILYLLLTIIGPKESIDPSQRKRLETDYKRKLKMTQRKMKEVKESETATTQLSLYHKNYEQRLKDMEGQLARAKNQYGDVNRQLKEETDRKTRFEQVSEVILVTLNAQKKCY